MPERSDVPVLERPWPHQGGPPLWQRVAHLQADPAATSALLLELPVPDRLDALQQLVFHAYGLRLGEPWEVARRLCEAGFGPDVGDWAPARADALLARWGRGVAARGGVRMLLHVELRLPAFLPLARAGVGIAHRWEPLFPLVLGPFAPWMHECLAAVSSERREPLLADAFAAELDPVTVLHVALELLRTQPSPWLVEQVLERATADYGRSESEVLGALTEQAAPHPELAAWLADRLRERAPGTTLTVADVLAVARPEDVPEHVAPVVGAALGDEAFGPHDRVRLVRIKAVGTPRSYLAVLRGDGGTVYRAGTIQEVARVAQGVVSGDDTGLVTALQQVLTDRL